MSRSIQEPDPGPAKQSQEAQKDRMERIRAQDRLIDALRSDVVFVSRESADDWGNQLRRRTMVRTLFAAIEGIVFAMKQVALELLEHNLSHAEHAILAEESYTLKDNGKLRIAQQYIRLPENLRFAFSMYARAMGVEYDLDVGGTHWQDFRNAIEIRNRLTHPKSIEDLQISDSDCQSVAESGTWFMNQVRQLQETIVARIRQRVDELKERLNEQRGRATEENAHSSHAG